MKRVFFCEMFLIAFSCCLYSCRQNDDEVSKTKMTFSLSTIPEESGRVKTSDFEGASVQVSLKNSLGVQIFSRKSIAILSLGTGYITEPIELAADSYTITEFLIVNNQTEITFATPMVGSPLASLVSHKLPFTCKISDNKVTNVTMDVVPVNAHVPADFGFVSFRPTLIKPLMISVFNNSNNALTLTNAKGYLLKDDDTLSVYSLSPLNNIFPFKGDPETVYTLAIWKDGFTHFSRNIVYNDLMEELNGGALKVYLQPALTIHNKFDYDRSFAFTIDVTSHANFVLGWGDGTYDSVSVVPGEFGIIDFWHIYPADSAEYDFTLTGDLNKISMFDGGPPIGYIMTGINFYSVKNIRGINFFGQSRIAHLDLTRNSKIQGLLFGGYELLLPDNSSLSYLDIRNPLLAPSLDYIIHKVYVNTVANSIHNGTFDFDTEADYDNGPPLGPVSSQSAIELGVLKNTYGWHVTTID